MSNSSNLSCIEYIMQFNEGLHPYQTLTFLVPTNDTVWTERDVTWTVFFAIIIGVLCLIYFCVGLTAVVLMVRKNSLRITTKTFFAVYLTMAILGFSRSILLLLDPFGILGFIGDRFSAWVIISRFLGSLGFPSLVGACTLIIMTLVKLAHAGTGKQWYENWCLVLSLIAVPYGIALFAEGLGHTDNFAALLSGLICEIFFVVWGVTICIFYLIAGKRLLDTVMHRHRRATMLSESHSTSNTLQHGEASTESPKCNTHHNSRTQRIKKKIIIISFGTAIAGIIYALVSAGGVTMVLLLIFYDCMGFHQRTNSVVWLVVNLLNYIAEVVLTLFILYSMTDVTKFVEFLKFALSCCYCCFAPVCIGSEEDMMPSSSTSQPMTDSHGTASSHMNSREARNAEMQRGNNLENPNETDISESRVLVDRQQRFKIDIHDSDSSIGSGEAPPAVKQSRQKLIQENGEASKESGNGQPAGNKVSTAQLQGGLIEHGGRRVSATGVEGAVELKKKGRKVSIAQLQGGLIEQVPSGRKLSATRLEGPVEQKQKRKTSSPGLLEQAQGGKKTSASRLEEPQKQGKKISLSKLFEVPTELRQKQKLEGYNSMDDVRQDALPLDMVGQLLSVKESPILSHKPLRFFRRSRESTPTASESHDKILAQSELRKLRHFPSTPSPATPTMHEVYSKHFASSHPVKSPHLQNVTSPHSPDSPNSPYKTPSETQQLLEKHDNASRLSRKGTI